MLEKINCLNGLSLFADGVDAKNPVRLGKHTIIYADNGRGKTTIADVLRSAATGECQRLKQRRTLGHPSDPSVALVADGQSVVLVDGKWSQTLANLMIFDATFVEQHVHSGGDVGVEHRRNHCQFVLGEEGVTLFKRVTELTDEGKAVNGLIAEAKKAVEGITGAEMSVEDFLAIPSDADAVTEVQECERKLEAVRQADAILQRGGVNELGLPVIDISDDEAVLGRSLDAVLNDAAEMTKAHIQEHLDRDGEAWLADGLKYAEGGICPFCGRALDADSLVEAYRTYFSDSYRELIASVQGRLDSCRSEFSDLALERLGHGLESNDAAVEFWTEYVSTGPLSSPWKKIETAWHDLRRERVAALQDKLNHLLEPMPVSETLRHAVEEFRLADGELSAYNARVRHLQEAIDEFKNAVSTTDEREAIAELRRAQLRKSRWEEPAAGLCTRLTEVKEQKTRLDAARDQAKAELDRHTDAVMERYQTAVNGFLQKCGAGFRIAKMDAGYDTAGRPRSDYAIALLGHEVSPVTKDADAPNFRTILSEGDRRTLGFAFFLARLHECPTIHKTAVVFDDPVSSLDIHRQTRTGEAVCEVAKKCGQVVVLTHDRGFAKHCWEKFQWLSKPKGSGLILLAIQDHGEYSILDACDVERLDGSSERPVRVLCDFLSGETGVTDGEASCSIRPALEEAIRLAYPKSFKASHTLGDMAEIIAACSDFDDLYPLKPFASDLRNLNNYAKQFQHGGGSRPDHRELLTYAQDALDFIRHHGGKTSKTGVGGQE